MVHVRVQDDEPFKKALEKWMKAGILRKIKARLFI